MFQRLCALEKYFPPGYEYEKERNAAGFLLGLGAALSLRFFGALYDTSNSLYRMMQNRRVLREGAKAASFGQLVRGHWVLYVPLLLFLTVMVFFHYFYYHRTTKSIYLMRRLPKRGVLLKSCVQAPLLCMAVSAVLLTILYLLYYGIYLLIIPAECLP